MSFDKFGLKIDLESIIEWEMVPMINSEFLGRFRTLVGIQFNVDFPFGDFKIRNPINVSKNIKI